MQIMTIPGLKANGNLSTEQFRAVKLTANPFEIDNVDAVTDVPIGILQNKPNASGEPAEVAGPGSICKAEFGGAVQAGNQLKIEGAGADAGQLVAATIGTDSAHYIIAHALQDGANDQVGYVLVVSPHRAA